LVWNDWKRDELAPIY